MTDNLPRFTDEELQNYVDDGKETEAHALSLASEFSAPMGVDFEAVSADIPKVINAFIELLDLRKRIKTIEEDRENETNNWYYSVDRAYEQGYDQGYEDAHSDYAQ